MPRLSIIIPFRHNAQRLEATLLSVLENRPSDSEIIVIHDGTYHDPYSLGDEVVFVEEDPGAKSVQLLNAGMLAACSPAVCVLLDGTRATPGWAESPLELLMSNELAAVAVGVDYGRAGKRSYGLSAATLRRPQLLQTGRMEATTVKEDCTGATLACGFYRRKVLLAVGGWNEALEEGAADVELAWTLNALGLRCVCDDSTRVEMHTGSSARKLTPVALGHLASLAAAHGAVAPGLLNSVKCFMGECLKGRLVLATAWSAGLRDANTIRRIQVRLAHAKQQLAAAQQERPLRIFQGDPSTAARKAA